MLCRTQGDQKVIHAAPHSVATLFPSFPSSYKIRRAYESIHRAVLHMGVSMQHVDSGCLPHTPLQALPPRLLQTACAAQPLRITALTP